MDVRTWLGVWRHLSWLKVPSSRGMVWRCNCGAKCRGRSVTGRRSGSSSCLPPSICDTACPTRPSLVRSLVRSMTNQGSLLGGALGGG